MSELNVSLSLDSDGFLSQECPTCIKRFKVVFGEGSEQPVSFCPYCSHNGQQCWWTPEQVNYFADVAREKFIDPILSGFTDKMKHLNRPGGFLRVETKVSKHQPAKPPIEPTEEMHLITFECCNERVKHNGSAHKLHCVICGAVADIQ